MILTAETDDVLVEFEWIINGVIYPETTQTIDVEEFVNTVSVRGLNDCGNWSLPYELSWQEEDDDEMDIVLYIAVFIIAFMMFKES